MRSDSPLRWVRRTVFGLTQDKFAQIGGVSRTRVTRYEAAGEDPPFAFLQRIRAEALKQNLPFSGDWFFELPDGLTAAAAPEEASQ